MNSIRKSIVAIAIVGLVASCGTATNNQVASVGCELGAPVAGVLTIATTVAPITSIVANIAGGTNTVISGIVPEGTNSHTFETKPSDAKTL